MRTYVKEQACPFRFTKAAWGAFSNFQPLAVPIMAGPWSFQFSESLYQACKFPAHPDPSSGASPRPPRRGKRRPSAARPVSASTPAGTSSASTSCAGCCV